jgi:hypothetical protein
MGEGSLVAADVRVRLERWRLATPPVDPTHLHYLNALAQRMASAQPAVQQLLLTKLDLALRALEQAHPAHAVEPADPAATPTVAQGAERQPAPATPRVSPLARLNRDIALESAARAGGLSSGVPSDSPSELKSATRFRETWALISAEAEVDLATFRAPANAGPLNAHRLVLQALGHMRELSPDYLRHCLSHVDTLMGLDQAYAALKQPAGKSSTAKQVVRKSAATQRKR